MGAADLRKPAPSTRGPEWTYLTRDYFCVEPVSHVNNAIQMGDPAAHGLVALPAGDTMEAWMTVEVSKA